jgi:NAD+ diphosphatase
VSELITLDRCSELRTQAEALAELERGNEALVVPVWRSKSLVGGRDIPGPAFVPLARVRELFDGAPERVFLGRLGERACFAVAVDPGEHTPARPELASHGEFQDLRLAGNFLRREDAELLAYARGMLHWHRHNRFCSGCGGVTEVTEGGHVRLCAACDRRHFPRTDPAIMALLIHDGRCLLARQPRFPPTMFSVLAGFVEPGESLEDAVRREVREEAGLEVRDVRYLQSQPWPFPNSLMLGFSMHATSERFRLDDEELEEARWVSRDELRDPKGFFIPPGYSLSRQLIDAFLRGEV